MSWAHLIIGVATFVIFTITGKYMRVDFPDKEAIPQDLRLLMRSRHIYILFSSLIHLVLGVYLSMGNNARVRFAQYLASAVLIAASGVFIYAWWIETYQFQHFSDLSRWGIYLSLGGVGLHLVAGLANRRRSRNL